MGDVDPAQRRDRVDGGCSIPVAGPPSSLEGDGRGSDVNAEIEARQHGVVYFYSLIAGVTQRGGDDDIVMKSRAHQGSK
jgi:hypothetical protein